MKDNLSHPDLNLQQIADNVHLSPGRLVHIFKDKIGISPIQWLNQEKLKSARPLLATTNLPVEEVALRTGFADKSYFFRFFKQHEGMTPQSYRGSMQQDQ